MEMQTLKDQFWERKYKWFNQEKNTFLHEENALFHNALFHKVRFHNEKRIVSSKEDRFFWKKKTFYVSQYTRDRELGYHEKNTVSDQEKKGAFRDNSPGQGIRLFHIKREKMH
jgi:hypothetical protein